MKKFKITAVILAVLFITAAAALPVNAASDGVATLDEAATGKNPILSAQFLDGGDGWADGAEGPQNLFDNDTNTKYGGNPAYWADWKYDMKYKVNRIIIATANDNSQYPRRMGDGWTLSGSNDGKKWTVIYTGTEDDVINTDYTYYYIDLPDNQEFYQYYELNADEGASDQSDQAIQISEFVLCADESAEPDPEAETTEAVAEEATTEATTIAEEDNNAEAGDDNQATANESETAANAAESSGDDGNNNTTMIFIIIGAVIVIVIIVIIVLATKKKK